MTGPVLRIAAADGSWVRVVPIGPGDTAHADRLYARMATLPSVLAGLRRVEIVPAGSAR
ncbi:hypothetical protein ACH4T9_12290 [Micromonospora sp. NPDC020750]|uniref:hypothetical protein n=1 Tax=unclassified Micromonospora TaxID=2617518 RepID=UPI0037B0A416